jgi:FixJ family two-component response regulator
MSDPTKTYIAIVEDDESLGRSLARFLLASGYQPVTYLSAESFLNDTKQPEFDCLLVDIQLDDMSGIELGSRLATSGSVTPLILITAHMEWKALKETIPIKIAGFLRKNDSGETVLATVARAIQVSQKGAVCR